MTDLKLRSTEGVSFNPEQPPEGLCVEFQYIRGGLMTKYDVWNAIVRSIAKAGLLIWNANIVGTITFPWVSNVEIRFISSVNPPRYQTKSIIWTLAEAFDIYIEQGHYSNCFLKTQIGTGPTAQNLGVASIKSTLSTVADLQTNSSVYILSNETSSELRASTPASDISTQESLNQSLVSNMDLSISRPDSPNLGSLQAGSNGLSVVLNYLTNGATFSDKGFYRIVISTLVFAAQHEPKGAPSGVLRAYNLNDNYTLSIGPTSDAARDNLPWKFVISLLGSLPGEMLGHGPGGRWAELSGRIKLNGAYIGKLYIEKGDHRELPPESCGTAAFDIKVASSNSNDSMNEA